MFLANVLFGSPAIASGHWEPDHRGDGYPPYWVEDDDNSTPVSTPTPEKTVASNSSTPARSPSGEDKPKGEPTPNVALAKGIVDKILDKFVGPIFGVDPSTLRQVSEANDQKEAVSAIAESAVSNVLERIIPVAGWLSIALESTPTGADDAIKSPESSAPGDKGKQDGQHLPPPR